MKKTINFKELIELTETRLIQKKNNTEKKIDSIEKKQRFLKGANDIGNIIFQSLLIIILTLITFGMPIGAIASLIFSFNSVNICEDIIVFITGVPVPVTLVTLTVVWIRCLSETYDVLSGCIRNIFEGLFNCEEKLFELIYDKKYQKLCENSDLLSEQLIEIEWFKENHQYLSRDMTIDKQISKFELIKINKLLKKESLINVFFLLYNNHLNKLKGKEEFQKEKLKSNIKYIAEQVKKETDILQQEITAKIENGERVRRSERYHVIEQAYDKVDKKIRRLSPKR